MRHLSFVFASFVVSGMIASTAWSGVNVNVNVGIPLPPAVVVTAAAPEFIMSPSLGFYVSVGEPNLYMSGNVYYMYRGNAWYSGPYYNGPWKVVRQGYLPEPIRRHRHEEIVRMRDEDCRQYRERPDGFHGRHFKPDKAWKEERKERKREMKEERKARKHEEKEYRKEMKHHGHGHD